jgi:hypothetical protein
MDMFWSAAAGSSLITSTDTVSALAQIDDRRKQRMVRWNGGRARLRPPFGKLNSGFACRGRQARPYKWPVSAARKRARNDDRQSEPRDLVIPAHSPASALCDVGRFLSVYRARPSFQRGSTRAKLSRRRDGWSRRQRRADRPGTSPRLATLHAAPLSRISLGLLGSSLGQDVPSQQNDLLWPTRALVQYVRRRQRL